MSQSTSALRCNEETARNMPVPPSLCDRALTPLAVGHRRQNE
eukprot:SAG11_NODE_19977_length_455_cov_0.719101_1_plen_41_part_01